MYASRQNDYECTLSTKYLAGNNLLRDLGSLDNDNDDNGARPTNVSLLVLAAAISSDDDDDVMLDNTDDDDDAIKQANTIMQSKAIIIVIGRNDYQH